MALNTRRAAPAAPRRREPSGRRSRAPSPPGRPRRRWPGPTRGRRRRLPAAVFRDCPGADGQMRHDGDGPALKPTATRSATLARSRKGSAYASLESPVSSRSCIRRPPDDTPSMRQLTSVRAGLLARIRPRLLRHHLRPRERRAAAASTIDDATHKITRGSYSSSCSSLSRSAAASEIGPPRLLVTARRRVAADRCNRFPATPRRRSIARRLVVLHNRIAGTLISNAASPPHCGFCRRERLSLAPHHIFEELRGVGAQPPSYRYKSAKRSHQTWSNK